MQRTFETVKEVVALVHKNTTYDDKMALYNTWAEHYEQDVGVLDFQAPIQAANSISSHFSGDHEAAAVLDVACGTGLVAKQMAADGFRHFLGIDGNKTMLEQAKKTGLYQDLKQSYLGGQPLPVPNGSFDVVVISGALSVGHIHVSVLRDLCNACKPGGYVCMTCRHGHDNLEYKDALERELKRMEKEGLWGCVAVTEVENWERAVSEQKDGYISGTVYFYKKQCTTV